MAHRLVDIKHSCGYIEHKHSVELGQHVKHDSSVSVEDHLRVKPCPKCNHRGVWTWLESKAHHVAAVAESKPKAEVPLAESKPKA